MTTLSAMIAGALVAGYAVVALFFTKFWFRTRDRLFGMFAFAFLLLAAQRVAMVTTESWAEDTVWPYTLRLLAFLVILVAIIDKNRAAEH